LASIYEGLMEKWQELFEEEFKADMMDRVK